MDNQYLNLPFTRFDTQYLETLPDEVFFAKRFKLSDDDEDLLLANSSLIHGRRFYRAKVRDPLMKKYAQMTNPREGDPGSKTNPLVRFGKRYVYNSRGDLVQFVGAYPVILTSNTSPSDEQIRMAREASEKPIVYSSDCPKSSPERLQRFRNYGFKRNLKRAGSV